MSRVPILRLGRILLASIQYDLTDDQVLMLQEDILALISKGKADGIVLDITGLDVIDSYVARALNETTRMARLIGGEVVMTGMQPTVALTLVEIGREIIGIEAAVDLEAGVERLRDILRVRNGELEPFA